MNDITIQKKYYFKLFINIIIASIFTFGAAVLILGHNFSKVEDTITAIFAIGTFALIVIGSLVNSVLWLMFFSFRFNDDYIVANQGIISRQERHLPYVTMQDIVIVRDLLDRILGLSTIRVENAAMGGGMITPASGNSRGRVSAYNASMGMFGNSFVLSGITAEDAERLKLWLLDKSTQVVSKQEGHEL